MYIAYFDESGHVDEKFIAIAGFVATEERWNTFNERWSAALDAHGAAFLHTTDLMNYKRAFSGWTRERENALMTNLMDVIHGTGRIAAVGAVIALDDFRSLTAGQQARLKDPFFVLFQEVINGAALEAYFDRPDVKVNMVYSQTNEFAGTAMQLFEVMAAHEPRMGTLKFADMRDTPGLQAADLLAYELWRYYKNQRVNPEIRMRWALRRILWQQRVLNIHLLKTIPRWYLRLQLSPFYGPVMTAIAIAVAIPAYFKMTWFSKANRAPALPPEDEAAIAALEAQERRQGLISGA